VDSRNRIGPADAQIVVFNKGGRDFRLDALSRGEEVPREFFYGFFELGQAGLSAAMMSSSGAVPGLAGTLANVIERGVAVATGVGVKPLSMRLYARSLDGVRVAISYTDGFSLSLGLGFPRCRNRPILIGGFHGLSDIEGHAGELARPVARALIRRSLAGLDHAFFFGTADRDVAIDRYGVSVERSSVIPFGVDTDFWRPLPHEPQEDFVVAIGQDRNRDYDLLAAAPGRHPIRIVTRRYVNIPPNYDHVQTTVGDFFNSDSMTDRDLRRLYNAATAVIVPLKDVYQPSGYSVTLQAMSCGRPVVLSNIRGLWTKTLLEDGENCLLVPPGDAVALGAAIGRIRSDSKLARRLGRAARETVVAHFGLDKIGAGTVALARLGLDLWAKRNHGKVVMRKPETA
jgi:glycosyltransferase involved in cell wall biosynthesis